VAALVLCPLASAVERDPEAELRAEEKEVGTDEVFLDDMRVAAHGRAFRDERRPGLPVVGRLVDVGAHVAEGVQVEGDVGRALSEVAGVYVRDPGVLRQAFDVADDVRPGLAPVARDLDAAVGGAGPGAAGAPWVLRLTRPM